MPNTARQPNLPMAGAAARQAAEGGQPKSGGKGRGRGGPGPRVLSKSEREARERALLAARADADRDIPADGEIDIVDDADIAVLEPPSAVEVEEAPAPEPVVEEKPLTPEELRERELAEMRQIQEDEERRVTAERERLEAAAREREAEEQKQKRAEQEAATTRQRVADDAGRAAAAKLTPDGVPAAAEPEEETPASRQRRGKSGGPGGGDAKRATPARGRGGDQRRRGKLTVSQALDHEGNERTRSLASVRRARERERREAANRQQQEKFVRDVIVPETITVQELSNRMAERGADVIKSLMKMGVMATITQVIDADTAELIVSEFGHRPKRVSESDVMIGFGDEQDSTEELLPRPPVVTVMGHVDHGKTSLLDALRQTDVVAGEAGGITQHIGAYQVSLDSGDRITFIDTPGHAAFTAMRARGAKTTDVVVLVVAADDGVMPQTIEAIRHAKAAEVPMIVAINKCDLPAADPTRVQTELLQHDIVVEAMGGDVQTIEVSAKTRSGLDELKEAILLQAEILELKANPNRAAQGVVVEAKLDRGRGPVGTMLIQRGTLNVGDIFVAGAEWGRVRALVNDRGEQVKSVGPAAPVEILGLNGTPLAGDDFVVVDNEQRARDVSDFRARKKREAAQVAQRGAAGSLETMFERIRSGEAVKALPVVIKGDVQGSIEAIAGALEKLTENNDEVTVKVLHNDVGAITESDVTLASASDAMIVGFNVRANPQAREAAKRDGVEIRYYSVIYDVIDDVRNALTGLLAPTTRESFIGYAEIREVFSITKVGKVAGCYIRDGVVRRGAGVRLLRDDVVIHEGKLKTLKRFKDEVKEVRENFECGMAFENYDDIRVGDVVECFEVEEVRREL